MYHLFIVVLLLILIVIIIYVAMQWKRMMANNDGYSQASYQNDCDDSPPPMIPNNRSYFTPVPDLTADQRANLGGDMLSSQVDWAKDFKKSKLDASDRSQQTAENPLYSGANWIGGGRRPMIKLDPKRDQMPFDATPSEIAEYNASIANNGYRNY